MISAYIYFGLIILFTGISFGCLKAKKESLVAVVSLSAVASCLPGSIAMGIWIGTKGSWKETTRISQTIKLDSIQQLTRDQTAGELIETKDSTIVSQKYYKTRENDDLGFPWSIETNIIGSSKWVTKVGHEDYTTLKGNRKK